ncbi:hypothetical protein HK098_005120 [Nowakowskiella sp. JEL0407]|nr:hypothetical protein HK098_005120 [Nowakowskiella sp. JEL0407]
MKSSIVLIATLVSCAFALPGQSGNIQKWWTSYEKLITGNVTIPDALTSAVATASPAEQLHYLTLKAIGTQNYICVNTNGTLAWTLEKPVANLFLPGSMKYVGVHGFNTTIAGPPFWTIYTKDAKSSVFTGKIGAVTVDKANIPWLATQKKANTTVTIGKHPKVEPIHKLYSQTTFVLRVATKNGVHPGASNCTQADIDSKKVDAIKYTADYWFYVEKSKVKLEDVKAAIDDSEVDENSLNSEERDAGLEGDDEGSSGDEWVDSKPNITFVSRYLELMREADFLLLITMQTQSPGSRRNFSTFNLNNGSTTAHHRSKSLNPNVVIIKNFQYVNCADWIENLVVEMITKQSITDPETGRSHKFVSPFLLIGIIDDVPGYQDDYLSSQLRDVIFMRQTIDTPITLQIRKSNRLSQASDTTIFPYMSSSDLRNFIAACQDINFDEQIQMMIRDILTTIRTHSELTPGSASLGSSMELEIGCRAIATISGSNCVTPEHVNMMAEKILSHRLSICGNDQLVMMELCQIQKQLIRRICSHIL